MCAKMRCRSCMQMNLERVVNMSYAVSADGKTLYDYFNDCTQLKATSSDNLPKLLCITCTQNLRSAYNFRQAARRSDKELKKALNLHNVGAVLDNTTIYTKQSFSLASSLCTTEGPKDVKGPKEDEVSIKKPEVDISLEEVEEPKEDEGSIKKPEVGISLEEVEEPKEDEVSIKKPEVDISVKGPKEDEVSIKKPEVDISLEEVEEPKEDVVSIKKPDVGISLEEVEEPKEDEVSLKKAEIDISPEDVKGKLSKKIHDVSNEYTSTNDDSEALTQDEDDHNKYVFSRGTVHACEFCDCEYTTQRKLKHHIFNLHRIEIICVECPKVYELPRELELHKKLVHDTESPVECPWCKDSTSLPRDQLSKHLQAKHNSSYSKYFPSLRVHGRDAENPFQCERCQQCFSSINELADHIQTHKFDCPLCSMSFKKHTAYRSHIKRIHNHSITSLKAMLDESKKGKNCHLECSICSRQFRLKGTYQLHMRTKHSQSATSSRKSHTRDLRTRNHVDNVNETRGDAQNMSTNEMQKEVQEGESIECKYCHKKILTNKIAAHERRHVYRLKRKKKFLCAFCSREFKCERSIKLHEKKIHLCEKPELKECPICQKKVDPNYLKNHLEQVHATERKFVCDTCGDGFKSYTLLHYHKRLHAERKFPCTVCPKKFIRSCDLKVHMRVHTGEEPFECHLCDRRFKIKVRLNYHLQRHAGIKRKCQECGQEFNHVKQLKLHSYKHTGMPYKCPVCNYGCAQREVFRRHLLRMHDMAMTPEEYRAMFKANTGRNPFVKTLEELQEDAKNSMES